MYYRTHIFTVPKDILAKAIGLNVTYNSMGGASCLVSLESAANGEIKVFFARATATTITGRVYITLLF